MKSIFMRDVSGARSLRSRALFYFISDVFGTKHLPINRMGHLQISRVSAVITDGAVCRTVGADMSNEVL